MREIMIGADPEFFIKRKRHIISAHPFPFGTKETPLKTQNGYVQVDGIALECNVTPSKTCDEFVRNVRGVMDDLRTQLKLFEPEAEVVAKPSVFCGNKFLQRLPMVASDLGCRPDWNAWTEMRNRSPDPRSPIRTTSGHLHISWTEGKEDTDAHHFHECVTLVRQLDYYLGMPSLLWDKDARRRSLYGQAGAFRPKSYGLEYRVLSSAWTSSDRLTEWVFTATKRAVDTLWKEGVACEKMYGAVAQTVINNNNRNWPKEHPTLAEELLQ